MVERFVGLDVSQRLTSVCILDERGIRVWRGKCATDPAAIADAGRTRAGDVTVRLGIETGPRTPWLVPQIMSPALHRVWLAAPLATAPLSVPPHDTDVQ